MAAELGWVGPIDELLRRLSAYDLREWRAFFELRAEVRREQQLQAEADAKVTQRVAHPKRKRR